MVCCQTVLSFLSSIFPSGNSQEYPQTIMLFLSDFLSTNRQNKREKTSVFNISDIKRSTENTAVPQAANVCSLSLQSSGVMFVRETSVRVSRYQCKIEAMQLRCHHRNFPFAYQINTEATVHFKMRLGCCSTQNFPFVYGFVVQLHALF